MGFFYILEREMVDSSLTLIVNVHILFRIKVASKAFTPCIMINKCASAERISTYTLSLSMDYAFWSLSSKLTDKKDFWL